MEKRARKIFSILRRTYQKAKIVLRHGNAVQLLVAVMLSAQCTDKRVNMVTESLFRKYRTARDFAAAKSLEREIRSTGFFRAKARNIREACRIIDEKYSGKVPNSMDELIRLPGVGRKTANVVLSNAYGKNEGIAVDTHVRRLAFRLGLTENTKPDKIEKDLMKTFPRNEWNKITYLLIEHGRALCKAPVPLCSRCSVAALCPKNGVARSK